MHGVAPMTTLPGRVIGAKPAVFCRWVFGLLGAAPGDTLDDLYPGSGSVGRAWAAYIGQPEASCPSPTDASRPATATRLAGREVTDMTKWLLDLPDAPNPFTGRKGERVMVHDQADLDRRLAAAKTAGVRAEVRELTGEDQ